MNSRVKTNLNGPELERIDGAVIRIYNILTPDYVDSIVIAGSVKVQPKTESYLDLSKGAVA